MSEIRLYVTTTEILSGEVLDLMSDEFGEEDVAVATTEVDEKRDIWEASIYLARDEEEVIRGRFRSLLGEKFAHLEISCEVIPDVDWIAKSLEGLKPVRAGRFVVHGAHDRDKIRANDLAIEIEAGQAFGTGHHGTTAGCLEMIGEVVQARRTLRNALDLGTGSGVLAIAVAMLRPIPILATDIDPVAVRVASENVEHNGVRGITLETAPGFHSPSFGRHGPFDLIIANILARPLMKMAPQLAANLAPGGSVILSGILASQRWKVLAAYNGTRLRHVKTIWRNGWVTIHLRNGM